MTKHATITSKGRIIQRRRSLRGILKGKMDSKGLEKDLRKLRHEWSL